MNRDLLIGLSCAGFMVTIISITICYIKRWMCFAVKSTLPCLLLTSDFFSVGATCRWLWTRWLLSRRGSSLQGWGRSRSITNSSNWDTRSQNPKNKNIAVMYKNTKMTKKFLSTSSNFPKYLFRSRVIIGQIVTNLTLLSSESRINSSVKLLSDNN